METYFHWFLAKVTLQIIGAPTLDYLQKHDINGGGGEVSFLSNQCFYTTP